MIAPSKGDYPYKASKDRMAQRDRRVMRLAQCLLSVLKHEDFHDAVDGLKIAMLLLPTKANS
jgi:hypothetical protein